MDAYHQQYANQSDERIADKLVEKRDELVAIFSQIPLPANSQAIRLAVMGCGDKRFIAGHKRIFEEVSHKPIEVTTFDISIEHVQGEERVIKHDCTLPLPGTPYTITYAHVLLKFIEIEKQWEVLKNSYDALEDGGVAIHVLDKEDYETGGDRLQDNYFTVPLSKWKERLSSLNISFQEIPVKYGLALVLLK